MDWKNTWLLQLIKICFFVDSMQFMNSSLNKLVKKILNICLKNLVISS